MLLTLQDTQKISRVFKEMNNEEHGWKMVVANGGVR